LSVNAPACTAMNNIIFKRSSINNTFVVVIWTYRSRHLESRSMLDQSGRWTPLLSDDTITDRTFLLPQLTLTL
jgi:hypothetical protein